MGKVTVEAMVDGGKATAGPPIGNQLGPLKVNTMQIVKEINEKTKELSGMKVPVKIIVDTETKKYSILVGTPPISALIKKELKIEKGSGEAGKIRAGDLTMEQVRRISKAKFGDEDQAHLNQVIGSARSSGVTIEKGAITEEERKAAEAERQRLKAEAEKKAEAKGAAAPAAQAAPAKK
ncbi:MAG TPA: 50S ribosomal protein L11 [archaeon]|nr:50S ribosomal protein L11 [archaeon]